MIHARTLPSGTPHPRHGHGPFPRVLGGRTREPRGPPHAPAPEGSGGNTPTPHRHEDPNRRRREST